MPVARILQLPPRLLRPLHCAADAPAHSSEDSGSSAYLCLLPRSWLSTAIARASSHDAPTPPTVQPPTCASPAVAALTDSECALMLQASVANPSADSEHGLVRVVVRCVELLPSGSAQSSGAAASTDLARPTHSLPAYLSLWCKRREHERRARLLQQLRGAGAPGDNRAQLPTSSASPPLPSLTADLLRELYPNAPVVHLCECNDATGCTPECPAAAAGPPTATTATLSDTTTTTIISGLDTPPLPAASVNLTPTLLLIRHGNYCLLVQSYHRHTLDNVVCQCPGVLGRSVARPLFVTYQLILALRRLHALGLPHGSLLPHQVGITSTLMIHLDVPLQPAAPLLGLAPSTLNPLSTLTFLPAGGDLPLYTMSLPELTTAWCRGWVSNLDYLLALNRASGRCSGDPNNHPVVPWIIDCQAEAPTQGWRDLTYTKYRLNKGDEQLDIAWESVVPHHVSDILSELTYFVYLARRTPLNLLTQYVRSQWVPNEYPSSMARLFAFSPDECIPEFYTDPSIFYSIHPDLPDLEVPIWAASPEEFVRIHRLLLESDEISAMLHHWIDLTFGYKLTGQAAKAAKNVVFAFADGRRTLTNHGVVQLFSRPHPQRIVHGDNDLHDAIESARGQHRKELAMEASSGEVVGKSRPPALASVPPENVVDDVAPSADVNSGVVSTDVAGQTGRESKEAEVGADSGALMRPSTSENSENPAADDVAAAPKPIEEPSTPLPAGPMLYTQSVSTGINSGSMTLISSGALAPVVGPIALPDNLTPVAALTQLEALEAVSERSLQASVEAGVVKSAVPSVLPPPDDLFFWDLHCLGTLVAALFLDYDFGPEVLQATFGTNILQRQWNLSKLYESLSHRLPSCVRYGVLELFSLWPPGNRGANGLCRTIDATVDMLHESSPFVRFAFPPYFGQVHQLVSSLSSAAPVQRPGILQRHLAEIRSLPDEGFGLVCPLYEMLFNDPKTMGLALPMLESFAERLLPRDIMARLLPPLQSIAERGDAATLSYFFDRPSILALIKVFGMGIVLDIFLPYMTGGLTDKSPNVRRAAVRGFHALLGKCGPGAAARFVLKSVLRTVNKPPPNMAPYVAAQLADHFGSHVAETDLIPYAFTTAETHCQKGTTRSFAALMFVTSLVWHALPLLPMDRLTHHVEGLTQRLLHPLLQTVISPSQTFDASQRQKLAMRCLDLVMLLCTRLGRPLAQERLMPLVQTFFSYFNCISRPGSTQTTDGADNSATAPPTSDTTSSTTAAVDPDGALLLDAVFTPTLASFSYQHFCQLIGQETLRRHLSNIQLIEELMYEREHDVRSLPMLFSTFADEMAPSGSSTSTGTTTTEVAAATPSVPPHAESDTIPNTALPAGLASTVSPGPSEGFSPGTNGDSVSLAPEVLLEYEQVDVLEGGSTQGGSLRADENVSVKTADAYERWAQGWMSYWRHHGDRVHAQVHPDFDFQSRLLQVYTGHTAVVYDALVLEDEMQFLTASKDKTVRLWNVTYLGRASTWTQGIGGGNCRHVYSGHRRSVSSLAYDAHRAHVASCDGQLHLWDLETNTTLGMYDFGKQGASRIVSVGGQHVIAAATLDGRLAFVDPRAGRIVREWQSSLPTLAQKEAGGAPPEKRTVQAMTCDADGRAIITGTASGRIVALDARTGVLESAWIAHEGEVTGLLALSSERVVSGSSNGQLALLDTPSRTAATRCKLAHHDPVLSFDMIGKDLVALQASNRLSVFGQLERQPPTAAGAAHRLRHLRGANATVLRAFPLNQWLLVGSESGPLSLFA